MARALSPCRQNFLPTNLDWRMVTKTTSGPQSSLKENSVICYRISCAGFVLCQSDYNRHALFVENRLSYNYGFSTLEPECCYQALTVPVSVNQGKPGSGSERPSRLRLRQNNGANISPDTISVVFWQNWILSKTTRTLFPGTKSI